ncbi:hypothetical protein AAC387_Pa04g1818 [Persea americana]
MSPPDPPPHPRASRCLPRPPVPPETLHVWALNFLQVQLPVTNFNPTLPNAPLPPPPPANSTIAHPTNSSAPTHAIPLPNPISSPIIAPLITSLNHIASIRHPSQPSFPPLASTTLLAAATPKSQDPFP